MRKTLGWIFVIVGAVVLLGVIAATGRAVYADRKPCKGAPPVFAATQALYAKSGQFGANGQLCFAWRPKIYFQKELALRAKLTEQLATAATEEDAAKKAVAGTQAERTATLKTARELREQLEADLAKIPADTDIAIFIDGVETGAMFEAQVSDTVDGKPVVWKEINLRAPEDFSSTAAKDWRDLLRGVSHNGSRAVIVGFGDKGARLPRDFARVDTLEISAFKRSWLIIGAAGFLLLATGLFTLGWNTGLLRTAPVVDTVKPPFSLARVQMAWWFCLTLGGFLFIWLTSAQWMGVMTSSVVTLLGISGVSGLAAVAIDKGTQAPPPAPAPPAAPATSQGFLTDLVSDGQSIVLHRVQMLTWTVILGLIFVWSVMWNYAFPTFDTNLLILAGIVNGVYLGFKFPENRP